MVARAIHEESQRAEAPFVAVSCAASAGIFDRIGIVWTREGRLHVATGARMGRFELADGGTLFLDEIVELTPNVQVKLLRVLQERSFESVGGTKTLTVDIRLIAAGNRDLEAEVEAGKFRKDLFYRLNVVPWSCRRCANGTKTFRGWQPTSRPKLPRNMDGLRLSCRRN